MFPKRKYFLFIQICLAGWSWLFFTYHFVGVHPQKMPALCFMKQVAGIPCPSCGSTRAALYLLQGDLYASLTMNPLGTLALPFLICLTLLLVCDWMFSKQSLLNIYEKLSQILIKKHVFIPAAFFICANWLWNILKGM